MYRSGARDLHEVRRMSCCYKRDRRDNRLQAGGAGRGTLGLGDSPEANNQLLRAEKGDFQFSVDYWHYFFPEASSNSICNLGSEHFVVAAYTDEKLSQY